MKGHMKKLLALLALVLTACPAAPQSTASSTNPDVRVGLLTTTDDGCKVYRGYDGGYYFYFVRCPKSEDTTAVNRVSCGKNCSRPNVVQVEGE